MNLPELAEDDVIQVVMTAAFYAAHLRPLLEAQDFRLVQVPVDNPDGLATYILVLGESRAAALR